MFRYYIICLTTGKVTGTNNRDKMLDLQYEEDYITIDKETDNWFCDNKLYSVEEEY